MPRQADFYVWSKNHRFVDSSVAALVQGGNVGHAAIKLTVPQSEVNKEYIAKLKAANISVTEIEIPNSEGVKISHYEIFFSYWTNSSHDTILGTELEDKSAERDGRTATLDEKRLERFKYSPDEIQNLKTTQRKNIFSFYRHRKDPENQRKEIFSGVQSIVHLGGKKLDANVTNGINLDKFKTYEEAEAAIKARYEIVNKEYKQLSSDASKVQTHFDTLASRIIKNLPPLNEELSKKWFEHIKSGNWTDDMFPIIKKMEATIAELEQKETRNQEEAQRLQELKDDLQHIRLCWTPGVNPDFVVPFDMDTLNLDMDKMLETMLYIATKKQYEFLQWNCSSTALAILLSGVDTRNLKMNLDPVRLRLPLAVHMLKPNNEKIIIYTPDRVLKRVIELQVALDPNRTQNFLNRFFNWLYHLFADHGKPKLDPTASPFTRKLG